MTKNEWRSKSESLDLKFDELNEQIEIMIRHIRGLRNEAWDLNTSVHEENDDVGSMTYDEEESDDSILDKDDHLSSTRSDDYHPHASIVRSKVRRGIKSKSSRTNKKTRIRSKTHKGPQGEKRGNHYTKKVAGQQSLEMYQSRGSKVSRKQSKKRKRISEVESLGRFSDNTLQGKKRRNGSGNRGEGVTAGLSASTAPRLNNSTGFEANSANGIIQDMDRLDSNANGMIQDIERADSSDNESQIDTVSPAPMITEDLIFEDLASFDTSQQREGNGESSIHTENLSINSICDQLSVEFPKNEEMSCKMLRQLPLILQNPHALSGNSHYISVFVFQTMLKLLHLNGASSLQDHVQTNSPTIGAFVELLLCLLNLLKQDLNVNLNEDDGTLFKLFAPSRKETIIDFIMLQMIDVLYSQLLPEEWGMTLNISNDALHLLKKLRDKIGSMVHLSERVIVLLLKKLNCQQWQRSTLLDQEGKWFVSSMTNEECSKFWIDEANIQGKCFWIRFSRFPFAS